MLAPLLVAVVKIAALTPCTQVSWDQVVQAIRTSSCLVQRPNVPTDQVFVRGDLRVCSPDAPSSPVAAAVALAFEDVGPLFLTVPNVYSFNVPGWDEIRRMTDHQIAEERARDALFQSEELLSALVPRITARLGEGGLCCDGCPVRPGANRRTIRWVDLAEYVAAFLWIDPLPEQWSPKVPVRFHVCGALNGVSELPTRDVALIRAGYIAAVLGETTRNAGLSAIEAIVKTDEEFAAITTLKEKTAYLRRRLLDSLRANSAVRDDVCSALMPFLDSLGLDVEGCGLESAKSSNRKEVVSAPLPGRP